MYVRFDVPCIGGAPGVVVQLTSPAVSVVTPTSDVQRGTLDSTTFTLYRLPEGWSAAEGFAALPLVAEQTYTTDPADPAAPFATLAAGDCGSFLLRSSVSDNDTNGWGLTIGWDEPGGPTVEISGVPGSRISIGLQQATIRLAPSGSANACVTLYQYVAPGQAEIRFHNYDLDNPYPPPYADYPPYPPGMPRVRYYPPGVPVDPLAFGGGITGTASADGVWNGYGGTDTDRVGDLVVNPAPGWWRIVTCNTNTIENHIIQEGQTGVPVYLVPPPAPDLALDVGAPVSVGADTYEVSLTVRNQATGATAGTAYNTRVDFTLPPGVNLLNCSGAVCAPITGTAYRIDLGMIAAGAESVPVTLRLQTTPNAQVVLPLVATAADAAEHVFLSRYVSLIDP
jgi:hypothetical protein